MTDTNSIEPKPCPFCGKTNAKRHCDHASGWIGCECGVSGPRIKLDVDRYPGDSFRPNEEQKVVSAWNRRALSARASAGEGGEYVLVPRRLTAENGAKGLLSGEFAESVMIDCPECESGTIEDAEHCEVCGGEGQYRQQVPVEWTTIKEIHRMVVENLATAAPQPAQAGASGGGEWRPITSSKQYAEALAAGLRVEFTIFARDTYDMPPSDQDGSGGWVRQDHDDPWLDEGKHRAYYPVATPTPPAHGDGEVDYAAKWFAECRRVLEDVSTEMRATGRGDTRFRRLIESMPRQRTTRPTPEAQEARDCTCPSGDGSLRWPCPKHPPVDANVAAVQRKLGNRSVVGLRKYGVSTERGDLSHTDWLRHLQEELMDAAVYVEAALALPAQGEGKNGY